MKQYFWLDQATNGIMRENFTFLNDFLNTYQENIRKIGFVTDWDASIIDRKYQARPPFWRATFSIKGVDWTYRFNFDDIDKLKIDDQVMIEKLNRNKLNGLADEIKSLQAKLADTKRRVARLVGQSFKTASTKQTVIGKIISGTVTPIDIRKGFYDYSFIVQFVDGSTREYTDFWTVVQGIRDYQDYQAKERSK